VTRDPSVPPVAALGVAVLAVSTSAILVRYSQAPSLVKAFYRVLFTVGLLAPVVLTRSRADFAAIRGRDAVWATVAGVALAFHFAAWFESLNLTSVAASTTLVQAQPVFVALGAWAFLDERITPGVVAGIAVALVGMATMTLGDVFLPAPLGSGVHSLTGSAPFLGDLLALFGAVTAAGYVLAGRSLRQRISLLPYVTVVYGVCALVLLGLTLAQGHPLFDYPPREWALFLAMAAGPGVFGHTVVNWALAHLESSVVSVSLLGEPVGSTLLALVLLAEIPSAATVLGGAVVLVGISLTVSKRPGTEADPDPAPSPTGE
jgi:drug/metabolite transporter (DMT)-like permease